MTIGVSDPRPETYLAKLFHKPRYDIILEIIRERMGNKVGVIVDAGCGSGALFEWFLKEHVSFDSYLGCDKSEVCLKYAGEGFDKIVCDISYIPLINRSVDMVICSEVLEHIENPYVAFIELLRISKNFVLVTFPDERIKNALGFKYLEHVSEPSTYVLLKLASNRGFKAVLYKRIYFIFPPSILDKIIPYNPRILKFLKIVLHILSNLVRQICLIKTEVLLFQKVRG